MAEYGAHAWSSTGTHPFARSIRKRIIKGRDFLVPNVYNLEATGVWPPKLDLI